MKILHALMLFLSPTAYATEFMLSPKQIAEDTYVVVGRTEDFSPDNGGDIANSAFIVTSAGVVVIDSGASRAYGEALRESIRLLTEQPIVLLLNTHHHPDHWFGNQAFDTPASALPAVMHAMQTEQAGLADNLYRLVGDGMRGTEPKVATREIVPGRLDIGGHALEMIALAGHSAADLVILDHRTGVIFAGDLVFLDRAPTTPHAVIADWQASLDRISALQWRLMVPGHGVPHEGTRGLEQTRAWLGWLDDTFTTAANEGADMAEVMAAPLPAWAADIPLARSEYTRSVTHLYGERERAVLTRRP